MNQFPTTPAPQYPFEVTTEHKTLRSVFESGKQQRRKVWAFPRRNIKLTWEALSQADIDTLWNFFNSRSGGYEPFWFFDLFSASHQGEYVGRGDGTTAIFELPGKSINSSTMTVYINGASTTAYTFSQGTGDAGSDRITFTTAPSNGSTITADFEGIIRFRVVFKDDAASKSLFVVRLYSIGLELQEVRI